VTPTDDGGETAVGNAAGDAAGDAAPAGAAAGGGDGLGDGGDVGEEAPSDVGVGGVAAALLVSARPAPSGADGELAVSPIVIAAGVASLAGWRGGWRGGWGGIGRSDLEASIVGAEVAPATSGALPVEFGAGDVDAARDGSVSLAPVAGPRSLRSHHPVRPTTAASAIRPRRRGGNIRRELIM